MTAARVSLAAAAAFLLLLALLHVLEPELDPSWRMISEYAIGPYGFVMTLAFFCLALSCASLAFALRAQVATASERIGLAILLATAAALAAAGVFPTDPITAARAEVTMHGQLHGLAAMIGIPGFVIAALLVTHALVSKPGWSTQRGVLLATAHLNWVVLLLMSAVLVTTLPAAGGRFGPEVPIGWPNRGVVIAECAWLIAVAHIAARVTLTRD